MELRTRKGGSWWWQAHQYEGSCTGRYGSGGTSKTVITSFFKHGGKEIGQIIRNKF